MSERLLAAQTVCRIIEEKKFFSALKEDETSAFVNMLVLTVLRRLAALEEILSRYVLRKFKKKDRFLKYLLLCGATEILYMDTPSYAAVNDYVELAKKHCGKFSSGLINAVLRKISAEKPQSNKVFPQNFKAILEKDYSTEQIKKMEKIALTEPPLDLSLKDPDKPWLGTENTVLFESGTRRLKNSGRVESLACYAEGSWWVQDLASALPVTLLGNIKNKKVLDLCAAPGGKTAQLLNAGALVYAVDIEKDRMTRLEQNIKRLNLTQNLKTFVSDGLDFLHQTPDLFDIIVLDAPCSATGTFRRHPEIMHFKTLEDVSAQAKIQQKLLDAAAAHVAPNGRLLYCTCSLTKAEGEQQIDSFLARNPAFSLCSFSKDIFLKGANIEPLEKNILDKQVLRTLPYDEENLGGMDGFFAACLIRSKS